MDYLQIIDDLLEFGEDEKIYKELYMTNPSIYEEPVWDWEEFINRYYAATLISRDIPHDSPSIMNKVFLEENFFPQKDYAVTIVKNSRYCPPFWHYHSFIELIYVLKGNCIIIADGKTVKMHKGDVSIISPNINHSIFSCHDKDIVINILMRYSTFISAFSSLMTEQGIISNFFWQMLYSKAGKFRNPLILFRCKSDIVLDRIVLDIYTECNNQKEPSNLMLKSYVMLLFGNIMRNYQDHIMELQDVCEVDNNITRILKFIRKHVDKITLPLLAEQFDLSEAYMSRLIRNETGYTFSQLLRDIRLRQASEMLRTSTLTIEEIVEAIGYTDTSSFYRNFKTKFGSTPANYRKHRNTF